MVEEATVVRRIYENDSLIIEAIQVVLNKKDGKPHTFADALRVFVETYRKTLPESQKKVFDIIRMG